MTVQISPQGSGVANGAGFFQFGQPVPQGTKWQLAIINLRNTSTINLATCTVYRGSASGPLENIDQLAANNNGTSGKIAATPFYAGQWLWVVWTGCDPGATCVWQAYGQQRSRSDPDFDIAAIGDGFPTIPAFLIAGSPPGAGAPGVFIGPGLPAILQSKYGALLTKISQFNIQMTPDGVSYHYEIVGTSGLGTIKWWITGWVDPVNTANPVIEWRRELINDSGANFTGYGQFGTLSPAHIWQWGLNAAQALPHTAQWYNVAHTFGAAGVGVDSGSQVYNTPSTFNAVSTFNDDVVTANGKSLGLGMVAQVTSIANSGAVTAGPTVVLTCPSTAYRDDRAYMVTTGFGVQSSVAGATATFTVTNGVGAVLLNFGTIPMSLAATNLPANFVGYFVNSSGGPVTTGIELQLTHGGTASNLIHSASAALPRWLRIIDVGEATDYPGAISL